MSFARTRLLVIAGALSGVALVLALAIGLQPHRGGPELAAPGADHAMVSADASRNGPVTLANGHAMGAALKNDTSADRLPNLKQYPAHPLAADNGDGGDEDGGEPGPGHDGPNAADTVVQGAPAAPNVPSTTLNFEGIDFPGVVCNCAPPDTNGEVGATQYVQIVNEGFAVWNKATGAKVYGPVAITTVWSGFGGVCETAGHGDPVVLYDQFANRWLVSQFAGTTSITDECVAISTTSDATGTWFRYDFHLGSNFYDYPHLAVWPDGYYMSVNVFNSAGTAYIGAQAFVFDRTRMLQGLSATFQTAPNLGTSSDPILPADVDGSTLPPNGAPESFVRWPGFTGTYQTYHYHVDWVTPTNSTFTTFASPAAAGFATCGACVPQPGTTSTLDTLDDRLMFRLAYRNIGGHESVVGNYTVFSNGVTGVRWFELRNVTSGPETVFQESTYQPDQTDRWMGSAAMDKNGDIAIGFNASSASVNPSIRYAARLAGDPINTLGQGEATLMAGLGSQTGTSSRWGDYADLTVDPVDDCTFWFTSEYYPSGVTSFNWRTRIGSFTLPGCATPQTLTSIGVTPASASVTVNQTKQFAATAYDQNGQPMATQPSFAWTVSGGGTIGATTGLFTAGATAGGPFTVTAAAGGKTGTASVTVTAAPVLTTITVSPTSTSVPVNGTKQFTATGYDQFGTAMSPQPSFSWSVSGGGTIGATTGLFTAGATAGGPFTVTAAAGGKTGTASVTVTAAPGDFSFTVSPASLTIKRGTTATYTIAITRTNGFTGAVTFSLTGGKPNKSTITFSPNGTTGDTVTLTVKTAAGTNAKTFTLTITGVSGSLSHTATTKLVVTR
ncbi:MAG TPA: hypothetical protein VGI98_00160 [Candidatus Limnocylindrales bacterium]